MRTPATINLIGKQGRTFRQPLTYKINGTPVDLTGYSAEMQIRPTAGSGTVYATLTEGHGITLGASSWNILIVLTAAQMAAIPVGSSVYDLVLTSGGGEVIDFAEGRFGVKAAASR